MEFENGVNVIIGATDAGKSAIFRSIMWALFNRPLGKGFISNWAKNCSVELKFDDCKIVRSVGKTTNSYKLNDIVFKAIGHNPPEEILKAHNLVRDLNVQAQIDPFFLLQSSPGEVAKYLNKVASLDTIDKTIGNIHKTYLRTNRNIVQGESYLEELREKYEDFSYLDKVEEAIEEATILRDKKKVIQEKHKQLSKIVKEMQQIKSNISNIKRKIRYKELVDSALDIYQKKNNMVKEAQSLHRITEEINSLMEKIDSFKNDKRIIRIVDKALDIYNEITELNEKRTDAEDLVQNITTEENRIQKFVGELDAMKTRLKKNMPDICPLCGNEI